MIDYKALKGDPTDNIPGVPGVGEKTAAKLIREFGTLEALYERIDEVKPDKLRDKLVEHRDAVFMGKDLSTIVRDLPVEFDLEAARLGDYDRETVIRLFREYEFRTLIERLPAMTGETAGDAAEALRGVATDGSVPAARVAGPARPSGWGTARPARPPAEGGGLQLSLDFDAVVAARPSRDGRGDGPGRPPTRRRPTTPVAAAPGDLPTALAAAIADPSRIEVHAGDRIAALEPWLAAQSAVGVGLLLDDPRPRRGVAARAGHRRARTGGRSRSRARTMRRRCGGCSTGSRSRSSGTRSSRCSSPGSATTRTPPPTPVAFDTQIAAYVLNAALRSQTIADVVAEQLDLILPPVAELDAAARAGLEALSALAVREPLERRLGGGRPRPPLRARSSCRSSRSWPAWRRPASRSTSRRSSVLATEFARRDLAARGRDLRRRRPRVQPRQPQAARADPVLRAQPAEGQADQDRLLDRRVGARGPAAGAPDDRQAPRVADLHEAALDLRRGAADADRRRRPPPHDVPPGRRRDRPPLLVRPEPPEHPDPDAARAGGSGARSWPVAPT